MSSAYEIFIQSLYRQNKLTRAEVWGYVPEKLTPSEAINICGPKPIEEKNKKIT